MSTDSPLARQSAETEKILTANLTPRERKNRNVRVGRAADSDDLLLSWQRKLVEETGIDFKVKPYTALQYVNAVTMFGSRRAMFRMVYGRSGNNDEIRAFKPTPDVVDAYFAQKLEKYGSLATLPSKEQARRRQLSISKRDYHLSKRFEDRMEAYLRRYDNPAPNDISTLANMVRIELRLEAIHDEEAELAAEAALGALADKNYDEAASRRRRSELLQEKLKLTEEHRELQKALGINRATREKYRQDKSMKEILQEVVEQSYEWLMNQCEIVEHCGIRIAILIPHFLENPFVYATICPRCNKKVEVRNRVPNSD
jgi:hypothetical protein